MDVSLTLVVAGLTLPMWLPLVLWYAADRDEKASVDGAEVVYRGQKDKAFRHARSGRQGAAWKGNAAAHSAHTAGRALEA